MATVFKYALANRPGYQEILMPKGAKVIRVKLDPVDRASDRLADDQPRVLLWAIVDQAELPHLQPMRDLGDHARAMHTRRTFCIEMTGADRPYIKPESYVGTYDDGPHVLHIFEVLR